MFAIGALLDGGNGDGVGDPGVGDGLARAFEDEFSSEGHDGETRGRVGGQGRRGGIDLAAAGPRALADGGHGLDEVRDAVAVRVLREGIKQQIGESGEAGEFEGVRDAVAVGIGVAAGDADETAGTGRTGELSFRRRVAAGREEEFGVDRRREGEESVDLFLGLGRECPPVKVVIVVAWEPCAFLEKENHLHVGLGIGPVEGLRVKVPIRHVGVIEGEENLHGFPAGGEGKQEPVVGKDIHDGIEGEEFRGGFAVAATALGLCGRIEEFHLKRDDRTRRRASRRESKELSPSPNSS